MCKDTLLVFVDSGLGFVFFLFFSLFLYVRAVLVSFVRPHYGFHDVHTELGEFEMESRRGGVSSWRVGYSMWLVLWQLENSVVWFWVGCSV